MALQTEDKVIGDVMTHEEPSDFSRDKKVVADTQTLVVGTIVKENASGEILVLTAEQDEVQLLAITGTLTAGTFTLTFIDLNGDSKVTSPIAYNANTAAIQSGIDGALGASIVTVAGTAITASTLTFDGTGYTNLAQTIVEVDTSDVTGVEDAGVTETTIGGAGGNDATGICLEKITTTTNKPSIAVLTRNAVVKSGQLVYGGADVTITDAKLKTLGILVRTAA